VTIATIDVSFISLRHILPALLPFLEPGADVVALVKPQFEAGREDVGVGGIVSDPAVQEAAVRHVSEVAAAVGLATIAMAPAAIRGATGNQEFFLHLRYGQT
jgi:23S rRNA (cytidine1920-2'-O)/16S rRNA (cytidine1409-2'-O)-methyltransferase